MKEKPTILKSAGWLLVYAYTLILLVPMYFIMVTSLKSGGEVSLNPLGLPESFRVQNFVEAFIRGRIGLYAMNSIIVTVISVALVLTNAIIVSFGIYKLDGKKTGAFIYNGLIISMFIPATGFISFLLLMMKLKLYNNLLGLILANGFGGLAFNVFILSGFLKTVPRELEEAGVMDGCTDFQSLVFVLIPVLKPVLISLGLFALVGSWNNLFTPLLLINNSDLFTIPLGILIFKGMYRFEYNLLFAAILISSVPLVVVYFRFQKYIVEALTGSVKG